MWQIRELAPTEVERVGAVLGLARLGQGDGYYLVAWEDDEPVGHAHLALIDPPELQDVSVRPEHRRQGVATALAVAAERVVRARGADRLRLCVSIDNDAAMALYRGLGYGDVGIPTRRVHGTIQIRTGPLEVDDTLLTWEKPLDGRNQAMETTNLDIYGNPPIPWSRAEQQLEILDQFESHFFLATVRPDGRPHVAGIAPLWVDGKFYFVSGPGTRKGRNLAERTDCALSASLPGLDLTFEGRATKVTNEPTLQRLAGLYNAQGWPVTVKDGAFTAAYSAPSAGPPPWDVYEFTLSTAIGVASAEPNGATRWRF
jgi:GNAT superfamily N-acetyltransferase